VNIASKSLIFFYFASGADFNPLTMRLTFSVVTVNITKVMHSSQLVLTDLVTLVRLEAELNETVPRSLKRPDAEKIIARHRKKIPPMILSHHDRIKAKGRRSIAPVQEWICRACFISIPVGNRQQLTQATDLFICESCGAYLYLPDGTAHRPADEPPVQSERAKRIATALAEKKTAKKKTARTPRPAVVAEDRLAVIKRLSAKFARPAQLSS
jgi:hypothetical protein